MPKKSQRKRMIESLRFAQANLPHYPWYTDKIAAYTPTDLNEYRRQFNELNALLAEVDPNDE